MELKIGETYQIGKYEVVPIKKTNSGKYWIQMLGMTNGPWPGEGDISNCNNDNIAIFVKKFGNAIDHFRLPTKEEMMRLPGIYPALIQAAEHYGFFWTGQDGRKVWLGTAYGSGHAYYVSSKGYVGNDNQNYNLGIAPAFNLDTSKVILNGEKIMLAPPVSKSRDKKCIVMDIANPENCNSCPFVFGNIDGTELFGCNAAKKRNFNIKEQIANGKPDWCPIVGEVVIQKDEVEV